MDVSKQDKTVKTVIIAAAVVVFISLAVCVAVIFLPQRNNNTVNASVPETARGDFIGYISPSEDKMYAAEETVTLSVSAKNGSVAYAMIAGQKIPLEASAVATDGYCVFSGNYVMPSSQQYAQELGSVAFFVTYEGVTQICYGGKLTIAASALQQESSVPSALDTTSAVSSTFTQATAKAIIVTGMLAEGKEVAQNDLNYNPNYGNLITGMTDYVVEKIIDNDEGEQVEFYKLLSGRAVKADNNVQLIDVNAQLEYNTAALSTINDSGANKIVIKGTKKVPYKIEYVGQVFNQGYEKLKYNVSPFCATAIDFIFDYTVSFSGSLTGFSDDIISGINVSINSDNKTMILHCVLRRQGRFFGYVMENDQNGDLCLSFRQPVKSLSALKIIIDPGHGDTPGAVDNSGKYREADQTLAISKHFASYLASTGAQVYMTRTSDTDVSLEMRRLMNQQIKPDLFISVHLNASEKKSKSGTSTFYFTPFSQPLASFINNRLCEVYNSSCYKDNAKMLESVNIGAHYYPFYVTRTDVCPSVLVEVGFISNDTECKYLVDPAYQQTFGYALYNAVSDFVAWQNQ